jgi:hypothetical protein
VPNNLGMGASIEAVQHLDGTALAAMAASLNFRPDMADEFQRPTEFASPASLLLLSFSFPHRSHLAHTTLSRHVHTPHAKNHSMSRRPIQLLHVAISRLIQHPVNPFPGCLGLHITGKRYGTSWAKNHQLFTIAYSRSKSRSYPVLLSGLGAIA